MTTLANLHGQILPLEAVRISVLDRAFLFGDGVYEVLRIYQGRPFLESEHFSRLARSLASIRIEGIDVDRLRERMHETIRAGGYGESTAYLQVTRGSAPRSHAFPKQATPLELLWIEPYHDHHVEARHQGGSVLLQPDLRWHRCDIKSVNLLANVLAKQAAVEAGCVEALLTLPDGTITEASHSSVFAVVGGSLQTTPHDANILPGITRALVLRLAECAKIPVHEENLHRDQLSRIDELFLTGTTFEILPVTRVDQQVIGSGQPGPITKRLQEVYAEMIREFVQG